MTPDYAPVINALRLLAADQERADRPLLARVSRFYADIVVRAARAELFDPEPPDRPFDCAMERHYVEMREPR